MTREEAIKELRGFIGQLTEGCQEAIKVLIPELKESEDERIKKAIVTLIEDIQQSDKNFAGVELTDMLAWLEKQKEQKPVEWSEEDELMRKRCIADLGYLTEYEPQYKERYDAQMEWLKSLHPQPHTVSIKDATKFGNLEYERGVKDGIQHAKNHQWKPSEGQMQSLSEIIAFAPETFKPKCTLMTLQNDLKKLMEE